LESRDWASIGLAGLAAFLIFLGGWSLFTSLSISSELGFSSGLMIQGIPPLAVGLSIGILVGGIVCAYLAYRYCSVGRWPTVRAVFGLVLVGLLIGQVVYAWYASEAGGGGGGGGAPSLSGSYQLFCDGVAVAPNVPFDIWFNDVRLGVDARFTINAELVLKNVQSVPASPIEFRVGMQYAAKTASGFSPYVTFSPLVKQWYPSWTPSGSDYKESVTDLQVVTIGGSDPVFFSGGECKFKFTIYALVWKDAASYISTGSKTVEFTLKSVSGTLTISDVKFG